jgi:hypothetical protein
VSKLAFIDKVQNVPTWLPIERGRYYNLKHLVGKDFVFFADIGWDLNFM